MNPRLFLIVIVLVAIVGGGAFFATRTIPAPHHAIEKVIGNDRFFK